MSAEKSVIGCLLMDIENIEKVYTVLMPEMFSDGDLGRAYGIIRKTYDEDKPLDANILMAEMSDVPGIQSLLVECMESVTVSVYIDRYADIVVRDYKARQLTRLLQFKPDGTNIEKQLSQLTTQLEKLTANKKTTSKTIRELAEEYKGQRFVDTRKQGIKTGISDLDAIVHGMDNGDVILVAARPGVGKTAFATQIALNTSKTVNTALISLEMTNEQLYDRIIAHVSGIELNRIRRALNAVSNEKDMFDQANDEVSKRKLVLVDDISTVSEIYLFLKRVKAEIAIIDYAQLIRPETTYRGNRYAEVGEISHRIKQMAKKLNIPIVLLTQLNRAKVESSEPSMAEIRESGDFEQDASVIVLLWNKTDDKRTKGVKVDKNRSGETGKFEINFDGKVMRFVEEMSVGETPFD